MEALMSSTRLSMSGRGGGEAVSADEEPVSGCYVMWGFVSDPSREGASLSPRTVGGGTRQMQVGSLLYGQRNRQVLLPWGRGNFIISTDLLPPATCSCLYPIRIRTENCRAC